MRLALNVVSAPGLSVWRFLCLLSGQVAGQTGGSGGASFSNQLRPPSVIPRLN